MNQNQHQITSRSFGWTAIALCIALLAGVAQDAMAQAGVPKSKAPAPAPKAAPKPGAPGTGGAGGAGGTLTKPPSKLPTLTPADVAAKEKILGAPEWKQTMHDFEQWLSAQVIYDPEQVKQIRKRMALGIERMTPAQLQRFQSDIQEKVAVLTSDEAQQAGTYLTETFAVASPAYARKIRAKLPDVLTMTASQISQQLDLFASKHAAAINRQKTFEADRQQSIAYNESQLAAMRQESDAALNRASSAAASSGRQGNYAAARDYFPDVGNDGPFGPGTSWGGFGFF
jgi:hypothetical protein